MSQNNLSVNLHVVQETHPGNTQQDNNEFYHVLSTKLARTEYEFIIVNNRVLTNDIVEANKLDNLYTLMSCAATVIVSWDLSPT